MLFLGPYLESLLSSFALKLLFAFDSSGNAKCLAHGSSSQCSNCMFLFTLFINLRQDYCSFVQYRM